MKVKIIIKIKGYIKLNLEANINPNKNNSL